MINLFSLKKFVLYLSFINNNIACYVISSNVLYIHRSYKHKIHAMLEIKYITTWNLRRTEHRPKISVTIIFIFATLNHKGIIMFVSVMTHQRVLVWYQNIIIQTPKTSSYQNSHMLINTNRA